MRILKFTKPSVKLEEIDAKSNQEMAKYTRNILSEIVQQLEAHFSQSDNKSFKSNQHENLK